MILRPACVWSMRHNTTGLMTVDYSWSNVSSNQSNVLRIQNMHIAFRIASCLYETSIGPVHPENCNNWKAAEVGERVNAEVVIRTDPEQSTTPVGRGILRYVW